MKIKYGWIIGRIGLSRGRINEIPSYRILNLLLSVVGHFVRSRENHGRFVTILTVLNCRYFFNFNRQIFGRFSVGGQKGLA